MGKALGASMDSRDRLVYLDEELIIARYELARLDENLRRVATMIGCPDVVDQAGRTEADKTYGRSVSSDDAHAGSTD
jgi:hypothetical protein